MFYIFRLVMGPSRRYNLVDNNPERKRESCHYQHWSGKAVLTHSTPTPFRSRAGRASAYMATLYYLEIIALMFGLLFLYGKAVSVIAGAVLTVLLTFHIIRLYLANDLHRKIQLCIIDLHAAFAAGFLFYAVAQDTPIEPSSLPLILMRAAILACELPLLCLLTGDEARSEFR